MQGCVVLVSICVLRKELSAPAIRAPGSYHRSGKAREPCRGQTAAEVVQQQHYHTAVPGAALLLLCCCCYAFMLLSFVPGCGKYRRYTVMMMVVCDE